MLGLGVKFVNSVGMSRGYRFLEQKVLYYNLITVIGENLWGICRDSLQEPSIRNWTSNYRNRGRKAGGVNCYKGHEEDMIFFGATDVLVITT